MKIFLPSFVLLLLTISGVSQTLPNNGFESWETNILPPFEDPEDWNTPNIYTATFGGICVEKSEDAYEGDYSASLKTIEILERDKVLDAIWKKGGSFLKNIDAVLKKYNTGAELSGIAPMFFITFKKDEEKTYKTKRKEFYTQLIRRGIFMQPYHHCYICYRHTEEDLSRTIQAIDEALDEVASSK